MVDGVLNRRTSRVIVPGLQRPSAALRGCAWLGTRSLHTWSQQQLAMLQDADEVPGWDRLIETHTDLVQKTSNVPAAHGATRHEDVIWVPQRKDHRAWLAGAHSVTVKQAHTAWRHVPRGHHEGHVVPRLLDDQHYSEAAMPGPLVLAPLARRPVLGSIEFVQYGRQKAPVHSHRYDLKWFA
jgi:hypothetical protein